MAVQTKVICDLTGKVIDEGNKFDPNDEIALAAATGGVLIKIIVPEGFDVDRNALFTAIGNLVPKRTRTKKATAEPPAGDPAPASSKRNKAADNAPAEA